MKYSFTLIFLWQLQKKSKCTLPEVSRDENGKSQNAIAFPISFFQVTFIKDLQYKECKNMPRLMPVELFSPIEEVHYKKVIYQGVLTLLTTVGSICYR